MIRKVIRIDNVGKFQACEPTGDVEFRNITLIYGENGRGKTTFCDILRSLRTGDPALIIGRATLGPTSQPRVRLRLEKSNTDFDGTGWSVTFPNLHIFDSLYVHNNVYAGEHVAHEQKRNLYRVIVGKEGVRLARRVDDLDVSVRDADSAAKAARSEVAHLAPPSVAVDDFVGLPEDPAIDAKITAKEAEIASLMRVGEIGTKPLLSGIELPAVPDSLFTVLAREVKGVAATAEQSVREHLDSHTAGATEGWIADGVGYETGDECPFCQQRTDTVQLLKTYRSYFSDAYFELKKEVARLRNATQQAFSEASRLRVLCPPIRETG